MFRWWTLWRESTVYSFTSGCVLSWCKTPGCSDPLYTLTLCSAKLECLTSGVFLCCVPAFTSTSLLELQQWSDNDGTHTTVYIVCSCVLCAQTWWRSVLTDSALYYTLLQVHALVIVYMQDTWCSSVCQCVSFSLINVQDMKTTCLTVDQDLV